MRRHAAVVDRPGGRPARPRRGARSFHSIGPAEVGLVTKRLGASSATTSSSPSTARPATRPTCSCRACASSCGRSTRSSATRGCRSPPDHIGLVIAQVGAGAAHRRQVGRLQARVRQLLRHPHLPGQRRPARRAAPGPAPGHHGADPPGRLRRHHQRPDLRQDDLRGDPRRGPAGRPDALQRHPHHPAGRPRRRRRRHHAGGPAVGRHRQPHRRLRRRAPPWRPTRSGLADPDHPGRAAVEERPARQLPGLPGVPRQRRLHRPPARPAALRLVPAQPVPREGRAAGDARRPPGRGRRHQVLRRPAHRGHLGRGVQVRLDRASRATRASGPSRCAPASTR